MTSCRKHNINNQCETTSIDNQAAVVCQPFEFCLPFGVRVVFNGECIHVEGSPTIADGEYGIIVVENGCITNARPNPAFDYTPPPCTPAVSPCDDPSSGTAIAVQPGICNMVSVDTAGRIGAYINAVAGDGITLSGCGTAASPLTIAAVPTGASVTYIISGSTSILPVTGNGTLSNPYVIRHGDTPMGPGTYGGIAVDQWGHVVGFTADASSIQNIVAGPGISVNQQGPVASISLEQSPLGGGTFLLGGFSVTIDLYGRVTAITQAIAIDPGIYNFGNYNVGINELGSITSITESSSSSTATNANTHFSKFFSANREDTRMVINTTVQGHMRIVFVGDLGSEANTAYGFTTLPATVSVYIDGLAVNGFVRIINNMIIELHVLSYPLYGVGEHTIEITGVATGALYSRPSFMDVYLVALGT